MFPETVLRLQPPGCPGECRERDSSSIAMNTVSNNRIIRTQSPGGSSDEAPADDEAARVPGGPGGHAALRPCGREVQHHPVDAERRHPRSRVGARHRGRGAFEPARADDARRHDHCREGEGAAARGGRGDGDRQGGPRPDDRGVAPGRDPDDRSVSAAPGPAGAEGEVPGAHDLPAGGADRPAARPAGGRRGRCRADRAPLRDRGPRRRGHLRGRVPVRLQPGSPPRRRRRGPARSSGGRAAHAARGRTLPARPRAGCLRDGGHQGSGAVRGQQPAHAGADGGSRHRRHAGTAHRGRGPDHPGDGDLAGAVRYAGIPPDRTGVAADVVESGGIPIACRRTLRELAEVA